VGLEWKDATEDLLGYVRAAGDCGGHGFAAVVGAGGYDSDWDCELVVCVSDGLVWIGMLRMHSGCGINTGPNNNDTRRSSVLYCVCA